MARGALFVPGELRQRLVNGAEHGAVQRIEFIPPRQHHFGNPVVDLALDPWFFHLPCPLLDP